MFLSGRSQGYMTKILILHPVLISGTVYGRTFKFYMELKGDVQQHLYRQSGRILRYAYE